jgi:hypothetical protein
MDIIDTAVINGKDSDSMKIITRFGNILLVVTLVLLFFPLHAYADGGAPNLAYVAGASGGISVIDIGQQKVTSRISASGDPHSLYLSLDGRFLYVTEPSLGRVTMYAAKTGATICSANVPGQPSLLTFDAGANILYAAGNGAASISAINPNTCAIEKTIHTAGPVFGLAIAVVGSGISGGNGNQLWVSDTAGLSIYSNGAQIANIPVPGGPQYITIPAGTTVYVTTQNGDVDAIDLNTHKVMTLLTGGTFGPMDYDAITYEVYVPDKQHSRVDVLAPINPGVTTPPKEPTRTIPLGVAPQSVAITSDGQLGFIALAGGNVAILDIPGKQLFNTVFVGGNPHFIITGLYPPLIGTTPQQASFWGTVINVVAYALVIAVLIVPLLLLRRRSRMNVPKKEV